MGYSTWSIVDGLWFIVKKIGWYFFDSLLSTIDHGPWTTPTYPLPV